MSAASLHRMLAAKLAVMALVIAGAVGVVEDLTERGRVEGAVADRAAIGAADLQLALADALDAPGLGDRAALAQALTHFCRRSAARAAVSTTGAFVLLRLLDRSNVEVARCAREDEPAIAALERDAAALRVDSGPGDATAALLRFAGTRYARVVRPLRDSAGVAVAWVEGYFALSPQVIADARWRLVRAVATGVAIVLLTTLLLYPVVVRLLGRVEHLSRELLDANLEMLRVVGSAIAKRDSDTDLHNFRVTIYAVRLAEALGVGADDIRVLIKGAFLHDVGKIGIRDNVLLKPGRLDDTERAEMQRHVDHGLDIIGRSRWLADAATVVGGHHEKVDGTGYFRHLGGNDIPMLARIFSIADVFDALSSKRPYKEPMPYENATGILEEGRGTHFDPAMVDAFLGIARGLYDTYAGRDDDTARADLERIVTTYFQVDMAAFLS